MQLINFPAKYTQKYFITISSQTYTILVITITVTRMTTKEETNDPANTSSIEFFVSITKNIHSSLTSTLKFKYIAV